MQKTPRESGLFAPPSAILAGEVANTQFLRRPSQGLSSRMGDSRRHRGAHPIDAQLFSEQTRPALMAAVSDLSWLRTRGYSDASAVKLVGDRYRLRSRQRTAAKRCACSDSAREDRASRRCAPEMMDARHLLIDGLNVITTIEVALARGVLLLGRDDCLRDMASFHGSYRLVQETERAVEILVDVVDSLRPSEVTVYIDRPVSNSGRLAEIVRTTAAGKGSQIQAKTADRVDELLKASTAVVASADSAILDECGALGEPGTNLGRASPDRARAALATGPVVSACPD